MAKKVDRRVRYTKMVLKESLSELLAEKPIEKITVKEICEKADINRGTFYSHYADEFDLYNSIVDEILESGSELLGDFMNRTDEEVIEGVTKTFEYLKENAVLIRTLLNNGIEYSVEKRIRDIIKSIYLKEASQIVDIELVNCTYSFIAAGSISLIRYWLNSDMQKSPREMAVFIKDLIGQGFRSLSV